MFVLSCDPGLRSGFAEIMFGSHVFWQGDDVPGGVEGAIEYLAELGNPRFDMIVIEQFKKREGTHGIRDDASRVIGAVTQWAHTRNIPVIMQSPDGRLKRVPDRILLKLYGDVLKGNANRNIKEAVRHATAYAKAEHVPVVLNAFRD